MRNYLVDHEKKILLPTLIYIYIYIYCSSKYDVMGKKKRVVNISIKTNYLRLCRWERKKERERERNKAETKGLTL